MTEHKIEGTVFAVNNRFISFCELDLIPMNVKFLKGLDPEYFEYIIERHAHFDNEVDPRGSIALKIALHHAIETFFSLVCAYVQAPMCIYAWIAKCRTEDLRKVVKRIEAADQSLPVVQKLETVSWWGIAKSIWSHASMATDETNTFFEFVAQLLGFLSWEFTYQRSIDEYNSLKHGFRVTPGGTSFSLRPHGALREEMLECPLTVEAEYGAQYLRIERVHKNENCKHFCSVSESSNWSLDQTANRLRLVASGINDVISASLIYCDEDPQSTNFKLPDQLDLLGDLDSYIAKGSAISMRPELNLGAECSQTESDLKLIFESWVQSEKSTDPEAENENA